MLDERRTLSPIPVVTTLPPELPEFLVKDMPEWQRKRVQAMLAEAEHQSIDDLPKPAFQWKRKPEPDLLAPLIYGIGNAVNPPNVGLTNITSI